MLNTSYWQAPNSVDGLAAEVLREGTFNDSAWPVVPHSLDGPFLCINNVRYGGRCNSTLKVKMQGQKCSECHVRSYPTSSLIHIHPRLLAEMSKNMNRGSMCDSFSLGSDPAEVDFDCVNKPRYGCPEKSYMALTKCRECIVRNCRSHSLPPSLLKQRANANSIQGEVASNRSTPSWRRVDHSTLVRCLLWIKSSRYYSVAGG